jgi:hypothetical protein
LALPISILAGTPGTRSLPVVTLAAVGWLVDLLSSNIAGCKISWFSGNICKNGYKDGIFHCLVWLAEVNLTEPSEISAISSKAENHHNHLLTDFPSYHGSFPADQSFWAEPRRILDMSIPLLDAEPGDPGDCGDWIGKVTGRRWPKDEGGKSLANGYGSIPIDTFLVG